MTEPIHASNESLKVQIGHLAESMHTLTEKVDLLLAMTKEVAVLKVESDGHKSGLIALESRCTADSARLDQRMTADGAVLSNRITSELAHTNQRLMQETARMEAALTREMAQRESADVESTRQILWVKKWLYTVAGGGAVVFAALGYVGEAVKSFASDTVITRDALQGALHQIEKTQIGLGRTDQKLWELTDELKKSGKLGYLNRSTE